MTLSQILLTGAGILALATAATYLIPSKVEVERTAIIDATPQAILQLASSNTGYQAFNPYKSTDPNLKITLFGPDSGVGSGFHFDGKDGKGSQTVSQISDTSVTYDIDLGSMGKPTQSLTVTPVDTGTQVTWRMETDMGLNPIARVFGLFMDRMIGKTFEAGLANLAKATA